MDFSRLIAPLSLEDFFQNHWEHARMFLPRDDQNYYNTILSIDDICEYLSRNDLRYPSVRLVKHGKVLPLEDYSKILKFGNYASEGLIQPDKVMKCFQDGATIVIQLAHTGMRPLSRLAVNLEKYFGFDIQMNCYITPANSQGFTAHYDSHSVFVIQLAGEKTWRLFGFAKDLPSLDDTFDEDTYVARPVQEVLPLTQGSCLYLPRGLIHDAQTTAQTSIHLTIGFFPPTWQDVLKEIANAARKDRRFRTALVNPLHQDLPAMRKHYGELIAGLAKDNPLDDILNRLRFKTTSGQIQNHDGRLFDALGFREIGRESKLQMRKGLLLFSTERSDSIVIRCYDKEISFPRRVEEELSSALSRVGAFRPIDLPGTLNEDGKVVLCRTLVREGLLTMGRNENP